MNEARIETLTAAFYNDPLIKFLFPIEESRAKQLSIGIRLFGELSSWVIDIRTDQNECCAVIGAASPKYYPPSILRSLFLIFMLILRALSSGMSCSLIFRWLRIFSKFEKMHPSEPHWYVLILGVHPNHQGKGLGGKLLQRIIKKADADAVPVYLETANPKNLDFYRKYGFETSKAIVPMAGCPTVWALLRKQEKSEVHS